MLEQIVETVQEWLSQIGTALELNLYTPQVHGIPKIENTEIIEDTKLKIQWQEAKGGSKDIAGYRIRLYKNGTECFITDTENKNTVFEFNKLKDFNFKVGDTGTIGIYSYSKNFRGDKIFNNGGTSQGEIRSITFTVISDKFIYISENGGAFKKVKMFISVNGEPFKEVKKEKLKLI